MSTSTLCINGEGFEMSKVETSKVIHFNSLSAFQPFGLTVFDISNFRRFGFVVSTFDFLITSRINGTRFTEAKACRSAMSTNSTMVILVSMTPKTKMETHREKEKEQRNGTESH